ncbi:hypothetical protein CLOM_g17945, partial [Closterium sp. NIES-68]
PGGDAVAAKNRFFEGLPPRHSSNATWRAAVRQRKQAANETAWPEFLGVSAASGAAGSVLGMGGSGGGGGGAKVQQQQQQQQQGCEVVHRGSNR